jgi:hypothetical protein
VITCTFTPDCGTEHRSVYRLAGHLAEEHMVSSEEALPKARAMVSEQLPSTPRAPAPRAPEPVAPTTTPTPEASMPFKPRPCPDCTKEFTPTGPAQKRCEACGKAKRKRSSDRSIGSFATRAPPRRHLRLLSPPERRSLGEVSAADRAGARHRGGAGALRSPTRRSRSPPCRVTRSWPSSMRRSPSSSES